jgi:hypothetical protein
VATVTAVRSAPPSPDPAAAERRHLAVALDELASAAASIEPAQEPLRLLSKAVRRAEEIGKQLASARTTDQGSVGEWLAVGCRGLRPQPSEQTLTLEVELRLARADAEAAKTRLPALESIYVAAANRVRQLQAARDAAVVTAVAAVARQRTGALAGALREVLEEHAATVGIADALVAAFGDAARRRGDHTYRDKRDNARRFGPAAARGGPRPCPAAAGTLRA